MKHMRLISVMAIVVILLSLAVTAGCTQSRNTDFTSASTSIVTQKKTVQGTDDISQNPFDYFPMETGSQWLYSIKTGEVKPYMYDNTIYMVQKDGKIQSAPFRELFNTQPGKTYALEIRVKGPDESQRPNTVELEILTDQLGIFRYTDKTYWGIMDTTGQGPHAMQLIISYSGEKLRSVYPYSGLKDPVSIYSHKIIYMWNDEEIDKEGEEIFKYLGSDNNVSGYEGTTCLHFLREVPEGSSSDYKAFVEHTWYAKGKGLVRLEQQVDGKTSMIWTLYEFTPGK